MNCCKIQSHNQCPHVSDDCHVVQIAHVCQVTVLQGTRQKHLDHTNETSPSVSKPWKKLPTVYFQGNSGVYWLCPKGTAAKEPWGRQHCLPEEPASGTQETALLSSCAKV